MTIGRLVEKENSETKRIVEKKKIRREKILIQKWLVENEDEKKD